MSISRVYCGVPTRLYIRPRIAGVIAVNWLNSRYCCLRAFTLFPSAEYFSAIHAQLRAKTCVVWDVLFSVRLAPLNSLLLLYMTDLSLSRRQRFWLGALHILPLCLAVLPWGVLAGSMAVSQGFTPWQSIGLSVFVFAGAAQLVTISMVAAGHGFIADLLNYFGDYRAASTLCADFA